ncbi:hypothetical protein QE152_g23258 [Popillia japonica]|uniref:Uncharacterized protein n=1 Tax=Popillia japonica TaxID=7064 RepID=A0AAW1KJ20_POPJA
MMDEIERDHKNNTELYHHIKKLKRGRNVTVKIQNAIWEDYMEKVAGLPGEDIRGDYSKDPKRDMGGLYGESSGTSGRGHKR